MPKVKLTSFPTSRWNILACTIFQSIKNPTCLRVPWYGTVQCKWCTVRPITYSNSVYVHRKWRIRMLHRKLKVNFSWRRYLYNPTPDCWRRFVLLSNSPEALDKMTSKSIQVKHRCVRIVSGYNDSVTRSEVGDHSATTVFRGSRSHPERKMIQQLVKQSIFRYVIPSFTIFQ